MTKINRKDTCEELFIILLACSKDISLFKYAFLTKIVEVGLPVKKLIRNKDKAFRFSKR